MENKIKVGIWGLGRAGNCMHISEIGKYSDMFEVVAGCDHDPSRLDAARTRCPNARFYLDSKEFLQDAEVELVTVATRSPDHVKHAIAAVEAGKMVLVEKPIAVTYEDALTLKALAEANPGKVYIRHNRRFESAFAHIRDIIRSGKLGHVFEIKLCRDSFQWRTDWQTIQSAGGGQLLNWGPHLVDHALQLLESPVKSCWSDLKLGAARGDAEDHVKIIFVGENKRVIDIEISGCAPIPESTYTVRGTRGSLVSRDSKIELKYLNPAMPEETAPASLDNPPLGGSFGGAMVPVWCEDVLTVAPAGGDDPTKMWVHLYNAIRKGIPYPITIEQAVEVVRWIDYVKKNSPVDDVR